MNSRFEKYKKTLFGSKPEEIQNAKAELHKTFAFLSQEEQKYANLFLHDIESGDIRPEEGKTLRDYISEYTEKAKSDQIYRVASALGLDESMLRDMMALNVNDSNINEYGRLDKLKATVVREKAAQYFTSLKNEQIPPHRVSMKVDALLRKFIISGGDEIPLP